MDYNVQNKSGHGVLRIFVDGYAFRGIEGKWSDFKDEPRNIRLSLVVDGVNPFTEGADNVNNDCSRYLSITERNFLWLWVYHNRVNDTRNQSIPICKRNKDI